MFWAFWSKTTRVSLQLRQVVRGEIDMRSFLEPRQIKKRIGRGLSILLPITSFYKWIFLL
ncbi:hypothetical protein B0A64_09175 [Flavobacterium araucananum]|uniref:Uncharacterized protein n=1 Tax=Flavobacterium araucananum TaxID=946678 RepID=A0A227PD43_9FLAO|nr:hypothetical protein B0A64_09175 [Flavobacterium araucananum]